MEAGDEDNLTNGGRAHLPACDGERGAHWNHEVPFAVVEDGRSHRNANHQTWGSERRRVCMRESFSHESFWNKRTWQGCGRVIQSRASNMKSDKSRSEENIVGPI